MADRIEVPLELEGFEVTGSEVIDDTLQVSVCSTRRPACHHCGSLCVTGHGRKERLARGPPSTTRPTEARPKRRLDVWIDHITTAGLPEFLNTWRG